MERHERVGIREKGMGLGRSVFWLLMALVAVAAMAVLAHQNVFLRLEGLGTLVITDPRGSGDSNPSAPKLHPGRRAPVAPSRPKRLRHYPPAHGPAGPEPGGTAIVPDESP